MENLGINSNRQTRVEKKSDNFFTPGWLVDKINYFYEGAIDLDPCADNLKRIPARLHYTFADDGLKQEWRGNIFCNPPYSKSKDCKIVLWVNKGCEAFYKNQRVLLLLPASLDTKWGQTILELNHATPFCSILFFAGRIKFLNSDYLVTTGGGRFASMLVYLALDNHMKFGNVFGGYGVII
jgi:phage N-6-adenine-methyltransferase